MGRSALLWTGARVLQNSVSVNIVEGSGGEAPEGEALVFERIQ